MKDHRFVWDFRGRRSIRMPGYDYRDPGHYGVTICANRRTCVSGSVSNSRMHLNSRGQAMLDWWIEIGHAFKRCMPGMMVIMPNHIHGIITIYGSSDDAPVGAALCGRPDREIYNVPYPMDEETIGTHPHWEEILHSIAERHLTVRGGHTGPPLREPSLPDIMDWYKTMTTNEYIQGVKFRGWQPFYKRLWQRNYWESCINTERQYANVEEYIIGKPRNWNKDELNPASSTRLSVA